VLKAAMKLADKQGIDALSMRKLGDTLGVEAMSLYNYVANKEDLLDGMVDLIFTEIGVPPEDADWRSAMRQRALSVRNVLGRHRWALRLIGSRTSPGPATLAHYDAVFGALRRAGFSVDEAGDAYGMLNSYTIGFAVQEALMPFETGDEAVALVKDLMGRVPTERYPYLTELMTERIAEGGADPAARFEAALDAILDAVDHRFAKARRRT
jgi:AcrR family transcriptional regulator